MLEATRSTTQSSTVESPSGIYATIQSAIDGSTAGDVIVVGPGNYDENVTVDRAVTLSGPNAGTAGHGTGRGPEAAIQGNVVITADGATVNVSAGSDGLIVGDRVSSSRREPPHDAVLH